MENLLSVDRVVKIGQRTVGGSLIEPGGQVLDEHVPCVG